MRTSRRTLCLAALALAVATAVANAPHSTAQPTVPATAVDDAVRKDARSYAADFGVTEAEAVRRLGLQAPAGTLDERLAGHAGFAGVYLVHTPDFRVVVNVADAALRATALAAAAELGLADVVDVRSVRWSLRRLEAARSAARASADRAGVRADSDVDVIANRAVLYVTDAAAATRAGVRVASPAVVEQVAELAVDDADVYGGLALTPCTSGFAVYDAYGTAGITTAGHCSNTVSYNGTATTFKTQAWTGAYDIQWHTVPGYTVRNWVYDGTSNRSITAQKSRDAQTINEYVCKRGKTTGYNCGNITSKTYNPNTAQNNSATFIRVHHASNTLLSDSGDSGMPWFNGNTAYGTGKGHVSNDAIYMAINYLSGLGAVFLHTGCACPILP